MQKIEFKKQEIKKTTSTSRFKLLHLVGAIQTNKIKYIPTIFDTVHSLCDLKVAHVLEKKCLEQDKKIEVLLQMNLCQEQQKSGLLDYQELLQLAREILKLKQLKLVGLMTIPAFKLRSCRNSKYLLQFTKTQRKISPRIRPKRATYRAFYGYERRF